MEPFRRYLKPGTIFEWNEDMENIFEESKEVIIAEIASKIKLGNFLRNGTKLVV